MSVFSERLKSVMKERGVTQAQLSALTGIPKSAISQYLSNKFKPRQERVYYICKALDTSPAWIMGYEGEHNVSDAVESTHLSEKEYTIICAYRKYPNVKRKIDQILSQISSPATTFDVFRAANSHDGKIAPFREEVSAERLKRLSDAPQTDEDL